MSKIKLILIILLLLPFRVLALSIKCPEIVSEDEKFSCSVEDSTYRGVKVVYKLDSVFSYVDSSSLGATKGFYYDNKGFTIGNNNIQDKLNFSINLKTNSKISNYKDYYVTLSSIDTSNSLNAANKIEDVSAKIRLVSNINTLKSLDVNNGKFTKKFSSDVYSYDATINSDSTIISAVPVDSSAKVGGDIGKKNLKFGINTFVVKVTSARGNSREYKLYITRPYSVNSSGTKKSGDATLKSLKITPGSISFKSNIYYYDVNVDNSVDRVKVDAIPNNSRAKVEINNPDKLVVGDNEIKITVTSEDGMQLSYVVVVHKKEKLSSDSSIKNLFVRGYDIKFKSTTYKYNLDIYNEEKLDIIVELNDKDANYEIIGNNNLKDKSVIVIKVTAPDGTSSSYTIKVYKSFGTVSKDILDYVKLLPLVIFLVLVTIILILKGANTFVRRDN